MERASGALVATEYFECERLCRRAIDAARRLGDFERIARAVLPLQESRRQMRQAAFDAGIVGVLDRPAHARRRARPGCVLVAPPLLPRHALALREAARAAQVCVVALARESPTREGHWPLVAAWESVEIRAVVPPPPAPVRRQTRPVRARPGALTIAWFASAVEALSQAGLRAAPPSDNPLERIDRLLLLLDAHPYDEAMHQALGEVARTLASAR